MERIDELVQEPLHTIMRLRTLGQNASADPGELRTKLHACVDEMLRSGTALGFAPGDVRDMAFAVATTIDEAVLAGPSGIAAPWREHSLQMHFFADEPAGEGFFAKLEKARAERRHEVIKVYYLCLLLGRPSCNGAPGGELEVLDLLSALRVELGANGLASDERLSPNGARPHEPRKRRYGKYALLSLPVGAVGVSAALYVVLAIWLASRASDLAALVETFVR